MASVKKKKLAQESKHFLLVQEAFTFFLFLCYFDCKKGLVLSTSLVYTFHWNLAGMNVLGKILLLCQ